MGHGTTGFGICPAGFWPALVCYVLIMPPLLPFGMAMYILCYYRLEVYNLPFGYMGLQLRHCLETLETLDLGLLNSAMSERLGTYSEVGPTALCIMI